VSYPDLLGHNHWPTVPGVQDPDKQCVNVYLTCSEINVDANIHINDEGLPLDKENNMRLSRVCGLAVWQRVSLSLERFDDLTKNEKNELFKNYIQAYVEYLEELKEKGKKVAMKIIFC
jgi:hypothetical protein